MALEINEYIGADIKQVEELDPKKNAAKKKNKKNDKEKEVKKSK